MLQIKGKRQGLPLWLPLERNRVKSNKIKNTCLYIYPHLHVLEWYHLLLDASETRCSPRVQHVKLNGHVKKFHLTRALVTWCHVLVLPHIVAMEPFSIARLNYSQKFKSQLLWRVADECQHYSLNLQEDFFVLFLLFTQNPSPFQAGLRAIQ